MPIVSSSLSTTAWPSNASRSATAPCSGRAGAVSRSNGRPHEDRSFSSVVASSRRYRAAASPPTASTPARNTASRRAARCFSSSRWGTIGTPAANSASRCRRTFRVCNSSPSRSAIEPASVRAASRSMAVRDEGRGARGEGLAELPDSVPACAFRLRAFGVRLCGVRLPASAIRLPRCCWPCSKVRKPVRFLGQGRPARTSALGGGSRVGGGHVTQRPVRGRWKARSSSGRQPTASIGGRTGLGGCSV